MTDTVTGINYISAFHVDTSGNVTGYIRQFEDALASSNQLTTAAASSTSGNMGQASTLNPGGGTSSSLSWNVTPSGSSGPVLVELDREKSEILVSGNFGDIILLNRAISAKTGENPVGSSDTSAIISPVGGHTSV